MEQSVALLILRNYSILYIHTLQCKYTLIWSSWQESNLQPVDYKTTALPVELQKHDGSKILPLLWKGIGEAFYKRLGDLYGNRTHVTAVKGPCLDRLTNRPYKDRLFPVCHGCMQPFALHMPSCCIDAAVTFGRLARYWVKMLGL